jgi:hypothetical protein
MHTSQNYSRVSENYTVRVKSHSACENRTLRVDITLVQSTVMRIAITFVPVEITQRVEITHYM